MQGKKAVLLFLVLSFTLFSQSSMKLGRNEGTMNIPASNVIGNGNVTVFAAGFRSHGTSGTTTDPTLGIFIGISNVMELSAKTAFTDFQGLGTSEVHLQITLPGNDRLRFFGAALRGDLFLSSAADTLNVSATAGKPEYSSYMRPSVVIDFDWLAVYKTFPLKTYLTVGMADAPDLLYRYDQIAVIAGVEWKMLQQSLYLDAGMGLYREKRSSTFIGDSSYNQRVIWFEPGFRYRLFKRYSVLGSFRITAYQQLKQNNPLPVTSLRGAVAFEIPLLFKETNTEAIRNLIFVERKKEKKKDSITVNIEQGKRMTSGLEKEFNALDLSSDLQDEDREKTELKKREEIQQKIDEIEKLLEEK